MFDLPGLLRLGLEGISGGSAFRLFRRSGRTAIYYLIGLASAVVAFVVVSSLIDKGTVSSHERRFNAQQARQTGLARRAIEDCINSVISDGRVFTNYSLPEIISGKRRPSSLGRMFSALTGSRPHVLAAFYVRSPGGEVLGPDVRGRAGVTARAVGLRWVRERWSALSKLKTGPMTPPLHVTPGVRLLGLLFPVMVEGRFDGVLTLVIDLDPVVRRYVGAIRSGGRGSGFVIDGRGLVVYSGRAGRVGRKLISTKGDHYPGFHRVSRRVSRPTGGALSAAT